ncbi:MAG: hypothetical protein QM739_03135 [Propionivibrio sp.]
MKERTLNIVMTAVGIALCGTSVGMARHAGFGTDPFTVLVTGLDNRFELGYGVIFTTLAALLLVGVFLLQRRLIGLSTIFTLVGLGFFVENAYQIASLLMPHPGLAPRVAELAASLVLISLASALYYTADLGVSPYDAVALILSDRTGTPFRFCRIGTDLICVIVGFLFGATLGVGTILTALCMGPLVDLFNRRIARPLQRRYSHPQRLQTQGG